jgi:hypothetical protein
MGRSIDHHHGQAAMTDDAGTDGLESVARAFLAAQDELRWMDAAELVDPHTRDVFQRRCIEWIDRAPSRPHEAVPSDTRFTSPLEILGLASAAEAVNLTSTEFLARFAEGVHPGNLHRQLPGDSTSGSAGQIHITRTFVEAAVSASDRATVRYNTEWWSGDVRNQTVGGIHSLELARTPHGWRVRDADLGGWGGGTILLPPPPPDSD